MAGNDSFILVCVCVCLLLALSFYSRVSTYLLLSIYVSMYHMSPGVSSSRRTNELRMLSTDDLFAATSNLIAITKDNDVSMCMYVYVCR
jgi:hypothetical protein